MPVQPRSGLSEPARRPQGVPAEIDKVRDFLNLLCHQTWKISDDWRQGALAPDIDPKQVDDAARAIERAFRLSVSTSTHFPCHRVVLSLSESDKIANGILLPDEGVALRRGLAVLEARLKTLDRSRALKRKQLTSTDWDRLDGYRKLLSGRDHYYIRREVFNALFAASAQRKLVLNHLIENGQITMAVARGGNASADRKPQDQFIWPDGGRRRSYEIVIPRG
jgi:hypothetical protein